MKRFFKRKIIIPVVTLSFFFIGVSFKNDFFEIAKQIEIFTGVFKTVNQNYVDENECRRTDGYCHQKYAQRIRSLHCFF